MKQHQLRYDFLILATGIQYNYFGHDDWRRIAPELESLDDADLILGKILTAFERAEEIAAFDHCDSARIQQLLTFVHTVPTPETGKSEVMQTPKTPEFPRMLLGRDSPKAPALATPSTAA